MSQTATIQPTTYPDGRTKQAFKDETDINKILKRAQKTGTISHLAKNEGRYADFSEFDYQENLIKLTQGRELFDSLPSEIRNEFRQNPDAFFKYVNDPANKDRLGELLPDLAAPGRQNIDVRNVVPADEAKRAAEAEKAESALPADKAAENTPPAHQEPLATPPADPPAA